MKLYLFKTQSPNDHHIDSLGVALQFYQGDIQIYSDYILPDFKLDHVSIHITDDLLSRLNVETDDVLVAHDNTVFIAESLNDVEGARNHFNAVIQLPIHTAMLVQPPRMTLPAYGARRLWLTGTTLYTNQDNPIPVAYGPAKVLHDYIVTQDSSVFHNQILHGGTHLLMTAFPPLAFDLRFEEVPTFASASLDQATYIQSIPKGLK